MGDTVLGCCHVRLKVDRQSTGGDLKTTFTKVDSPILSTCKTQILNCQLQLYELLNNYDMNCLWYMLMHALAPLQNTDQALWFLGAGVRACTMSRPF